MNGQTVTPTATPLIPQGKTVSKPIIKFMIGFIAGWCAACFPRLSALLAGTDSGGLSLFTFEYITLSIIFSIIIGFVVMIMEWKVAKEPKATFMMAIGIPALLTGSFNATNGAQQVNEQQDKISELVAELSRSQGISIDEEPLGDFEVLSDGMSSLQHDIDLWEIVGIKSAHAADPKKPPAQFNPGYKVMEPLYYISLGNAPNKELALTMVKQLKAQIGTATAVKTRKGYTILSQIKPLPRSDAIMEAARLKKQDIAASLIPAKPKK